MVRAAELAKLLLALPRPNLAPLCGQGRTATSRRRSSRLTPQGLWRPTDDRIWLSPMNSGSTLFKAQPRGRATFARISDFPFQARAATRRPAKNVVELLVEHSVPDVRDHVFAVHRVRDQEILGGGVAQSSGARSNDRP